MGDYLRKRYVEDELTIKELLRELGMPDNHRRLKRWLSRYNIKIRNKSEGVKLQHKRNPGRRIQFREMAKSHEVRLKQAQSRQSNHRETSLELAAISLLREFNILAVAQYAIDVYNFDIGLPDYKIGIELDGGNWHKERKQKAEDNQRDAKIVELGWKVKRFSPEDFGRLMKFAESLISD